jgi:hypothetical protein
MNMRTLITFAAITMLSACAVPLSNTAAKVQVHSQMSTLLAACQKIGPVSTTSKAMWSQPILEAKIAAREQVANLGGDTLVVTNMDNSSDLSGFTTTVHGTALRCY